MNLHTAARLSRLRVNAMGPLMLVCVLLLHGCGGSFSQKARKSLNTALAATNAAQAGFVGWDKQHQLDIVDRSTSKEEATAALVGYRAKRQAVVRAFTISYTSIAAAATLIPLVERGERKDAELAGLLLEVVNAASAVKKAIDAIRRK